MKNSFNSSSELLTPIVVLDIIRDSHMQQCQYDPEADSNIELSFDSTVEDWREACDLVSWKKLGRAINEWFRVDIPDDVWRIVLEPSNKKKLLGVCELIATKAERYKITPLNVLGVSCQTAGAFRTIRAALYNANVPVEGIKPSTELEPLLSEYGGEFLQEIGKIAPGVLPPIEIEQSQAQKNIERFLIGSFAVGMFSGLLDYDEYGLVSAISLAVAVLGLLLTRGLMKPERISFGGIVTFRDLSMLVSGAVSSKEESC